MIRIRPLIGVFFAILIILFAMIGLLMWLDLNVHLIEEIQRFMGQ